VSDNPSDAGLPRHLDPRSGGGRRHSHRASNGRHFTESELPPELDPRGGGGRHGRHSSGSYKRRGGPLAMTGKVTAAVLSVTVLITSGLMWATTGRNLHPQHINAIPTNDGLGTKKKDIDGKSQNILVVGNDSRAGLSAKQLQEVGTDATPGLDTDTILLVHLPADGSKASVISFPRDSYVDVPGYKKNKINAAYADGACLPEGKPERDCGSALSDEARSDGAQELIRTVSELTQVHIDHYVEVSLLGFYTISNALGGVNVCLARRWYDPQFEKGIDYPAGNIKLQGKLALAFVRERHGLPGGDLDRIRRQQAFIGALVRKVLSAGTLINPLKINRLVKAVSNSLTLDSGLNPFDLLDQMRNVAAGNVTFMTIPTDGPGKSPDGKDILFVNPTEVQTFVDKVIGVEAPKAGGSTQPSKPRTTTVPRSSVSVAVQNGTTQQGLAETTSNALSAAGFQVGDTTNADRQDYAQSVIEYGSGGEAAARTLAAVIPGATLQSDDSVTSGVRLILGANFTSVKTTTTPSPTQSDPKPTPSSTSSTSSPKVEQRKASSTACVN
jgi:LCP family protein required for cell wall assembly